MSLVNIDLKEKLVEERVFLKESRPAKGKDIEIKKSILVRHHKNTIFLNNLSFSK